MRFVTHCALLLFAVFGLAIAMDRWAPTGPDDDLVNLSVRQLQPSDDAYADLRQADGAKNFFFVKPLVLMAVSLAAIAAYRPSNLLRRSRALVMQSGLAKKGGVV
jgi:hypothetical protein